jgi:hypothetical protein
MKLDFTISDPSEFGGITFPITIADEDLENASSSGCSVIAEAEPGVEVWGCDVRSVEARNRNAEFPLSLVLSGETVSVNARVVFEDTADTEIPFVGSLSTRDHGLPRLDR